MLFLFNFFWVHLVIELQYSNHKNSFYVPNIPVPYLKISNFQTRCVLVYINRTNTPNFCRNQQTIK